MTLPGYDAWKLREPDYCGDTSEQEAAADAWAEEQFMAWAESIIRGDDK